MVLATLRSKKFKRNLLLGVLILIIPAFVLWGVGTMASKPQLLGEIGKHKVYADEFEKSLIGIRIQVILSYYQNSEMLNNILQNRQMLTYMTWERLIYLDAARSARIKVSNADIQSFISSHPLFAREGRFDANTYSYLLRHNFSMDARQFEELVRENLMVKSFRQQLLKNVSASPEEALEFYNKTTGKADLSYFVIKTDFYADRAKPTDEEVTRYYGDNAKLFYTPPKVNVEYVEFSYDDAKGKEEVEKKIREVYPELEAAPDKFIETASRLNLKYAETGPFSRDEIIPEIAFSDEFHAVAFSLRPGETGGPVFSSPEKGAAYILRKKEDLLPRQLSLDEVREDLTSALAAERSLTIASERAKKIYEELSSSAITLEQAALEFDTEVKMTGPISYKDYIENAGPAQEAVFMALDMGEGKFLPPVAVEKGILMGRVDKVLPADTAGFEKDKDAITKNLLVRKQMAVLDSWLAENMTKVKLRRPIEEM